ncbi:unnamed protein product [Paramecium octaurelia]|uniref:Uncharacterized protein n=1 Tax=Paramecium octaurelia TaxID=43137 RepID=A0A8S1VJE6_PAROT|nr:unnamed protein product [Paramecium octaurelia]
MKLQKEELNQQQGLIQNRMILVKRKQILESNRELEFSENFNLQPMMIYRVKP